MISSINAGASNVATHITANVSTATSGAKKAVKSFEDLPSDVKDIVLFRRNKLASEIANHYLDHRKYGLAGSDGSWWSNYVRYTKNNHQLLSLLFADSRNPFDKKRRLLVLWCKLSLSLFLSAAIESGVKNSSDQETRNFFNYAGSGFVISLIACPYGLILDEIAACSLLTRFNCCVIAAKWYGLFILICIASGSIGFIIGGALLAYYLLDAKNFIATFFLSLAFDYFAFFYFGIWSWVLISWDGFLILPKFPCGGETGFPPRFLPLLNFFPVRIALSIYGLGGSTYLEDKALFENNFPGRISIDVVPDGEIEDPASLETERDK